MQAHGQPALPHPARRTQAVTLFALTFVYVLNFLDRQLLAILAKPIQDSLHLTDGQLGLLGGLYFALFYSIIAIPVGWLADRSNRVTILSLACAIWSAATIACGLATSYAQLAIARLAVGFGEAGGVPPSYALIADTFPPGQRGTALGIFNLGVPIGASLGIAFGATVASVLDWRDAFIIIGATGVVTALLVKFLVQEPRRGALDHNRDDAAAGAADDKAPFFATIRMFFSDPVLTLTSLGGAAAQFVAFGFGNFAVLFLMREKGMDMADVAVWFALVVGLGMGAGMLVSGRVVDRFTRHSRAAAYALTPAISLASALPFYLLFVWAPTWPVALTFLAVAMFLNYFYLASSVALVQEQVRPNQRVLSGALLLLVMNLIGLGLGPTYVGIASDYFAAKGYANSLQISLYTLTPFYLVAITLFLSLSRSLRIREGSATGN